MRIKRRALYMRIWSTPIVHLAQELACSKFAIYTACRTHGIPLPGRGYWRKREAGIEAPATPLPDNANDYEIDVPSKSKNDTTGRNAPTQPALPGHPIASALKVNGLRPNIVHNDTAAIASGSEKLRPFGSLATMQRLGSAEARRHFLDALEVAAKACDDQTAAAIRRWGEGAREALIVLDLVDEVVDACRKSCDRPHLGQ